MLTYLAKYFIFVLQELSRRVAAYDWETRGSKDLPRSFLMVRLIAGKRTTAPEMGLFSLRKG